VPRYLTHDEARCIASNIAKLPTFIEAKYGKAVRSRKLCTLLD
jgi:hypothetical protein